MKKKKKQNNILSFLFFIIIFVIGIDMIEKKEIRVDSEVSKTSMQNKEEIKSVIKLENIIAKDQHPNYPTGCESVALYILLRYYNVDVTIEDIVEELPKGEIPYVVNGKMYGANPEKEFVGDPTDINSFGVYNKPIAKTANKFKKGAIAKNGVSIKKIKEIIASGNPVIAWVSINEDIEKIVISKSWYDIDTGEKVNWIRGEHAVVVYGYDSNNFYISNPYNGKKYKKSLDNFEYYYFAMGERIVYYDE